MKKEVKNLTTQLDNMLENIDQFSKEDIQEIRQSLSDLIALAEKAKKKHKKTISKAA